MQIYVNSAEVVDTALGKKSAKINDGDKERSSTGHHKYHPIQLHVDRRVSLRSTRIVQIWSQIVAEVAIVEMQEWNDQGHVQMNSQKQIWPMG